MDLDPRYSPGGDIYEKLVSQYGRDGAETVYAAAKSDEKGAIANALAELKHGPAPTGSSSTLGIFLDRITTDPFAAPLESANKAITTIGNSALFGLLKNPAVLVVVVGALALYFWPVISRLLAIRPKP